MSTTNYNEAAVRLKKLGDDIFGTQPSPEVVNILATDTYRKAFSAFLRGEPVSDSLKVGHAGGGGYLVPDEFEKRIIECLTEENVLRKISHIIQSDHDRIIPVSMERGVSYFVNEGDPIPESDEKFGQVKMGAFKMATRTKVSDELLEDSFFDVENYIAEHFAERFGIMEQDAFINGDGVGKPLGLLHTAPVGAETANSDSINIDDMLELAYSLKGGYRKNAVWLMHECIMSKVRKAYNTDGRNFWGTYSEDPTIFTLMGHPVYLCDSMPYTLVPGEKVVLFGDFDYFWIANRGKQSFKRQNELYSENGQIGFSASRRVDGKLIVPEAVIALQVKEQE